MKLVILTQPSFFVEEDKILNILFDEGMDLLHICKPDSEPIYCERLLSLLPNNCYNRIRVHEHFYLKQEFDLKGIHIDNPETPVPDGFSRCTTRSTTDIDRLKELKKKCDYVCLHNLFDCLDSDEKSMLSISQLEVARSKGLIDRHVYAMGGMSIDNVQMARELGFGGVCIRGDLWNRFSIQHELNFKELIAYFRKLRKAVG